MSSSFIILQILSCPDTIFPCTEHRHFTKGGIALTMQQLQQLKETVPTRADRVDILDVKLDPNMPAAQRAEQYLQQIKNPYAFRCGEVAVNVTFSSTGKPLKESVVSYLTALKNNA